MSEILIDMTTLRAPSGVNHFKPYEKANTRQLKRRVARISVNMAPMNKSQKTDWHYFSILSKSYFMHFIPRSHIYWNTGLASFLPSLQGWMFSDTKINPFFPNLNLAKPNINSAVQNWQIGKWYHSYTKQCLQILLVSLTVQRSVSWNI